MKEKIYRTATSYGTLTTVSGDRYILLAPLPVPPDSWQLDHQQGWSVVPESIREFLDIDFNSAPAFDQPRVIVTSFPTINPQLGELWVWTGKYRDDDEQVAVNEEPSEEDEVWRQLTLFPEGDLENV